MHQVIIDTLKETYSRDLRKQIVKSILKNEKNNEKESLKSSHQVLNKIFSYVISQVNWDLANNSNQWDDTPLKILKEVFPKLETTQWFQELQLQVTKPIGLQENITN